MKNKPMSIEDMNSRLKAADMLHGACIYLAKQFSLNMIRAEAQANVDARTMLINLQNYIMDDAYGLSGLTEAGNRVELKVSRREVRS